MATAVRTSCLLFLSLQRSTTSRKMTGFSFQSSKQRESWQVVSTTHNNERKFSPRRQVFKMTTLPELLPRLSKESFSLNILSFRHGLCLHQLLTTQAATSYLHRAFKTLEMLLFVKKFPNKKQINDESSTFDELIHLVIQLDHAFVNNDDDMFSLSSSDRFFRGRRLKVHIVQRKPESVCT